MTKNERAIIRRNFIEKIQQHAQNFIGRVRADNPQWSEEFFSGYQKGVQDASDASTEAELRHFLE